MRLYLEVVGWVLVCLMFVAALQMVVARIF
jgi:hypothetical protein